MKMSDDLNTPPKMLISQQEIKDRITELGQDICQDYSGKEITALCTLKGSFIFFADLIRELDMPLTCEFLGLSSYGEKTISSGEVKLTLDLHEPIEGRHVLIIEDIVDTGLTLKYMLKTLKARNPASLRVCSLLVKPEKLKTELRIDYTGFKIRNEFVVGYGLDHSEKMRGLPYIGYIENEH
jgi:hypoxanthine phosphoribosyltransferase